MHFFKKKTHGLEELKKEKSVTIGCVYASPERITEGIVAKTDEYPFAHAANLEKAGHLCDTCSGFSSTDARFCANCGASISMNARFCPYCGWIAIVKQ